MPRAMSLRKPLLGSHLHGPCLFPTEKKYEGVLTFNVIASAPPKGKLERP
jgi:hypothetical protein